MEKPELRPLGAGEMLDRAITLYVRWFPLIVAALAVVSIPTVALQALVFPQSGHMWSDLMRVMTTTTSTASRDAAEALATDSRIPPLAFFVIFGAQVLHLLMWSAIVSLIAGAYSGVRPTIGAVYRLALQRWVPQLVVGLAFLIVATICLIPVFIAYIVLIFAVIALTALHQTVVLIVVASIGGLLIVGALVTIGSMVFMTYELAAVAVVIETPNPIDAITIAMRRALGRGMKRRTIVAGLVLLLVSYAGTLPIVGIAVVVAAVTRIDALYFGILGVGTILLNGIVAAFAVVYAVDARVRREGFDLLASEPPLATV